MTPFVGMVRTFVQILAHQALSKDELHIILNGRNLEIGEQSIISSIDDTVSWNLEI